MGVVIPARMLVYGGIVEKVVGDVLVPLLEMFGQGVAQLFCFPSFGHRLPGRPAIQGSISRFCCWRLYGAILLCSGRIDCYLVRN